MLTGPRYSLVGMRGYIVNAPSWKYWQEASGRGRTSSDNGALILHCVATYFIGQLDGTSFVLDLPNPPKDIPVQNISGLSTSVELPRHVFSR